MVEECLESWQVLHRVEFPTLDGVEDFEQRRHLHLDVGAVHLVGKHLDWAAHHEDLVFEHCDRRLGVVARLFGLRGELVGVLVADFVGDELVDEVLAADLVELRQQVHELGEREGASGWRPCAEGAVGIGRVVVDAVEDLLRDAKTLHPAMELCGQRVALRVLGAIDDAAAHPAHGAVPR